MKKDWMKRKITQYLYVDEYGEIETFKTVESLENYLSETYYDTDDFDQDQIIFVYDNGTTETALIEDVIDIISKVKPKYR